MGGAIGTRGWVSDGGVIDGTGGGVTPPFTFAETAISANTAAMGNVDIYVATATGITITVSTADITDGRNFEFSDESGAPSVGTPVTIATEGSELIDGQPTAVISVPFGSLNFYARGGDLFSH